MFKARDKDNWSKKNTDFQTEIESFNFLNVNWCVDYIMK